MTRLHSEKHFADLFLLGSDVPSSQLFYWASLTGKLACRRTNFHRGISIYFTAISLLRLRRTPTTPTNFLGLQLLWVERLLAVCRLRPRR